MKKIWKMKAGIVMVTMLYIVSFSVNVLGMQTPKKMIETTQDQDMTDILPFVKTNGSDDPDEGLENYTYSEEGGLYEGPWEAPSDFDFGISSHIIIWPKGYRHIKPGYPHESFITGWQINMIFRYDIWSSHTCYFDGEARLYDEDMIHRGTVVFDRWTEWVKWWRPAIGWHFRIWDFYDWGAEWIGKIEVEFDFLQDGEYIDHVGPVAFYDEK